MEQAPADCDRGAYFKNKKDTKNRTNLQACLGLKSSDTNKNWFIMSWRNKALTGPHLTFFWCYGLKRCDLLRKFFPLTFRAIKFFLFVFWNRNYHTKPLFASLTVKFIGRHTILHIACLKTKVKIFQKSYSVPTASRRISGMLGIL